MFKEEMKADKFKILKILLKNKKDFPKLIKIENKNKKLKVEWEMTLAGRKLNKKFSSFNELKKYYLKVCEKLDEELEKYPYITQSIDIITKEPILRINSQENGVFWGLVFNILEKSHLFKQIQLSKAELIKSKLYFLWALKIGLEEIGKIYYHKTIC